jgi:predicted membrane protein
MNTQKNKFRPGIIIGVILILLGCVLIVSNIGLIPRGFNKIIVSWQMLLIVIGIISIVKRQTFHFHGLSMLCVGIFFIIPKVAKVFPFAFSGIDAANFISVYWPILLIAGGIILIIHIPSHTRHCSSHRYGYYREHFREKRNRFRNDNENFRNEDFQNKENCSQDEDFAKTCIFGNGRYTVIDTEFKGGTLQAIFGGIELDLRKAYLSEGETTLNIEAIFGGISLFVPDNWFIDVQVESVLGGTDDNRRITEIVDATRKLIIKGSAVFGGVEIRN